ncbi:MAG: TRAP transporter large permease [Burkholderiaceae bacterium]
MTELINVWSLTTFAVVLFFLGTPVLLVLATWVVASSYFIVDFPLTNVGISASESIKSFIFLAVPLFVITGDFLTEGGISKKLIAFSRSIVGFMAGATAATTMFSCGLFAAISGSNAATAATMGRLLGPEMVSRGVSPGLAGAIVAAGGTVGVIIPPSVIFLIYGVTMDVPSVDLFIGGMIPGLLMVIALVGSAVILTGKIEPGVGIKGISVREIGSTAIKAWAGFVAIGVIFFGIYWGYFSPTEAAGVVAIYCFLVGVMPGGELKLKQVPGIMLNSARLAGLLVPLVVFSIQFQQVSSVMGMPEAIQTFLGGLGQNYGPVVLIAVMMVLILLVGAITESIAVVLILGPILGPVAESLGIHPVHWGVVFVVGTTIGFITPPYGLNLFVVSGVLKTPYDQIVRNIFKLLIPLMIVWAIVTAVPWLSMVLLAK